MASNKKNRGLGRGLSALLADVSGDESADSKPAPRSAEMHIDIDLIHPNPDQPRRTFTEDALQELTESIKEKGVIQPLILRPNPTLEGQYQIVAGERRWRASQRAGLHQVPAIVREFNDTEALEVAIIENIQRADLNPIDEADGYQQLMEKFGHTQEQLAGALGKSRSHIANLLRLLSLPEPVRAAVVDGQLSSGHARTLVGRDNADVLMQKIIKGGLSVRQAEALARKSANPDGAKRPSQKRSEKDADTRQIEADLSAHLKIPVSIDHDGSGESGKLTLRYKNLEQLDDLLRQLSGS